MRIELDEDQTVQMAETFSLLSDPTRVSIVLSCFNAKISAGEIASKLNLSAPLVSHHLRLLRTAHILKSERRGKHIYYAMADQCVRDILVTMMHHLSHHAETDHKTTDLEGDS